MRPIASVGKSAKQIEISIEVMINSVALTKFLTSNEPSALRNFIKLREAKLHDELSSDMYSEQGLDALMRPVSGLVCQSLIVSSYWMPGSAHAHAASASLRNKALASTDSITSPEARATRPNCSPFSYAFMNLSLTRTELLAF